MKNLYKQLGIDPRSDVESIRNKIREKLGAVDSVAAREVLLNLSRRRVYDRAFVTASRIGVLEANLGLVVDEPTRDFRPANANQVKELSAFSQTMVRPKTQIPKITIPQVVIGLGMVVGAFFFYGFLVNVTTKQYADVTKPRVFSTPRAASTPTPFNHPVVAFPSSGSYKAYTNKALGPGLQITTPPGDLNSYYCKLVNVVTGQTEMVMFVEGGQTAEFRVPIGSYRLKYAYGFSWYGPQYLFGPGTVCVEAETIVQFSIQGDQYLGHSIELYKRPNGNFETENIPMSEF
jgi:hypothetical protein